MWTVHCFKYSNIVLKQDFGICITVGLNKWKHGYL